MYFTSTVISLYLTFVHVVVAFEAFLKYKGKRQPKTYRTYTSFNTVTKLAARMMWTKNTGESYIINLMFIDLDIIIWTSSISMYVLEHHVCSMKYDLFLMHDHVLSLGYRSTRVKTHKLSRPPHVIVENTTLYMYCGSTN